MQPSNSPNGRAGVAAPRRGESYGHADIFESLAASHIAAGFEHHDVGAGLAEHLGGHAAAGAGSDDADVVGFGLTDYLHSGTGYDKMTVLR